MGLSVFIDEILIVGWKIDGGRDGWGFLFLAFHPGMVFNILDGDSVGGSFPEHAFDEILCILTHISRESHINKDYIPCSFFNGVGLVREESNVAGKHFKQGDTYYFKMLKKKGNKEVFFFLPRHQMSFLTPQYFSPLNFSGELYKGLNFFFLILYFSKNK